MPGALTPAQILASLRTANTHDLQGTKKRCGLPLVKEGAGKLDPPQNPLPISPHPIHEFDNSGGNPAVFF
jgi:hypothetical protein